MTAGEPAVRWRSDASRSTVTASSSSIEWKSFVTESFVRSLVRVGCPSCMDRCRGEGSAGRSPPTQVGRLAGAGDDRAAGTDELVIEAAVGRLDAVAVQRLLRGGAGTDVRRKTGVVVLHVVVGTGDDGRRQADVRLVIREVPLRGRNGLAQVRLRCRPVRPIAEPEVRRNRDRQQDAMITMTTRSSISVKPSSRP